MSFSVYSALEKRYPAPAWALFWEVHDKTGFGHERSADAIAMSVWPSRGLELHGFEIKHSRSDWLREKKDIKKAEALYKYCDRWWLVVSDAKIVADGELPPSWGLLIPRGEKLMAKVEAPKLKPRQVDREFLAAILRRSAEAMAKYIPRDKIGDKLREEYDRGVAAGESRSEYKIKELTRELGGLKEAIGVFEKNAGVRIEHWTAGQIGQTVGLLRNSEYQFKLKDDLMRRLRDYKNDVVVVEKALAELEALKAASQSCCDSRQVKEEDAFSEEDENAKVPDAQDKNALPGSGRAAEEAGGDRGQVWAAETEAETAG